jgi:Ca2+-binding RTX toxin-like protein/methionine-rich copper-binding protein CopC
MADDYAGSTGTSGVVVVGGAARSGRIESVDDGDWFAVQLVAGRTYEFSLSASSSGGLPDPWLGLYDDEGYRITYNDDASDSNLNSLITFTATTSGTYYLGAYDYGTGTGSYRISAVQTAQDDHAADTGTDGAVAANGNGATGEIEVAGDSDWFGVTLNAGVTYTIRLQGSGSGQGTLADPVFEGIYTASGVYVPGTANDDYGDGYDSQVTFTPTASGTYYLAASGYESGTGSYVLSVSGQGNSDIAASTATTATLALGGTLRSAVGAAGDVDWVRVELTAGTTYVVELNSDGTAFNPLLDPFLVGIFDSQGGLLPGTTNDDYGIGFNSRVTFTPTSSGTYYLAAGAWGNTTGAYELKLLSTSAGSDVEGQTTGSAVALAVGAPATGSVDTARDVDWFAVNLEAGQEYRIQVRGADSGGGTLADPELIGLYDATGNILPGTGNDDADGSLDSQLYFRPAVGGTYYVAVDAADDGTGTYTVSVQTSAGSDDLPANVTTTAALTAAAPVSSSIGIAGDVDWVRVELTAGSSYRFDLLGAENGDGTLSDPLIVGIFDSRGVALPGSSDDDSGAGHNAQVSLQADATGTYYVAVGAFGAGTGSYSLTLTTAGPDTTAPELLATSPSDDGTGVAVSGNISLEFSEAVRAGSGSIVISGGGTTRTIDVTDTTQVTFSGSRMTINPAADLEPETDYTVSFGAGVVKDLAGNAFAGISAGGAFDFSTGAAGQEDTWTILVYMAADNNLEGFALEDLNEMESIALPDNVNVVTLVDRGPGYDSSNGDWTDTRLYLVSADGSTQNIGSSFDSLGELNTGAGSTLTDFINDAVAANPASHYALIVWNHGGGLSGTAWDDSNGNDNLTLPEMLAAVQASSVGHFDLIGFDACLQGMVEQAWDMRSVADVVVASQELEPGDGWEYHYFLDDLAADPSLNSFDLAAAIVDAYGQRYAGEPDTTLSATRTEALDELRDAIDVFTVAAIDAGSGVIAALLDAAERTTVINRGDGDVRDLGSFMRQIGTGNSPAAVKAAAAGVLDALDAAILAHTGTVAGVDGLSVYLPLESIDDSYLSADYTFLQATTWGNLLRFMLRDSGADELLGSEDDNDIRGFGGNDTLQGLLGDDSLDGGAGADRMVGGDGNDVYWVDNAGDRVVEELAAGGVDTINTRLASNTLPANVENGRILGTGSANLTGNALGNVLTAGAGANVLDGLGGADTASYATASAGVTVSLAIAGQQATGGSGRDTLRSIEHLVGSEFADRLTGNGGNNALDGGAGNDTASGGGGRDTLTGGAGNDRLAGGAGNDVFVFASASGSDTITDFASGADKLRIVQGALRVGDGDARVENAVVRAGPGGFSANAEVVIITADIAGDITSASAAAAIGRAGSAYAVGRKVIFAVDNGNSTGVFLFTSDGNDAVVSASELQLLATLTGTASTAPVDYAFVT